MDLQVALHQLRKIVHPKILDILLYTKKAISIKLRNSLIAILLKRYNVFQ